MFKKFKFNFKLCNQIINMEAVLKAEKANIFNHCVVNANVLKLHLFCYFIILPIKCQPAIAIISSLLDFCIVLVYALTMSSSFNAFDVGFFFLILNFTHLLFTLSTYSVCIFNLCVSFFVCRHFSSLVRHIVLLK